MDKNNLPSQSRTGRDNQVFEDGMRQVAVCVPIRNFEVRAALLKKLFLLAPF